MPHAFLSTAYLAPVQYYCKLFQYPEIRLEACENYPKQTYRNRCVIATANGVQSLSIPIVSPGAPKCLTRDVRISDHGHWRRLHWNALVSAYRTSPFFMYYKDDLAPFYEQRYTFLLDFNEALRALVCRLLDMQPAVRRTDSYEAAVPNDFRETIRPGDKCADASFRPRPYYQVFRERHGFLPNLSIADLLFNMGPESLLVLRDSIAGE